MSDDLNDRLELLDHALDVVKRWDDEDRRFFANWMTGYNADAVMRFELDSRQLPMRCEEPGGAQR